jgi:hypothetical protein
MMQRQPCLALAGDDSLHRFTSLHLVSPYCKAVGVCAMMQRQQTWIVRPVSRFNLLPRTVGF